MENYEKSCWLKILITRSYLCMICVFLDLLYIRYRSIYIKQTHTCCIFEHNIIHLTSTLLRTSPKHRTLSSWSNGRVSATHWSCASWRVKYLKFSADEPRHSPIVFVRKIPHDARHENQWGLARHELYIRLRGSTPNSLFSLWKGLCKEKKSKHLKDLRVFFHARQGFPQLCAGKQTCPTRQCHPMAISTTWHEHVHPAAARLFRMLPLVPFNGRQTMINCTCIQLLIKHSNIKTPKKIPWIILSLFFAWGTGEQRCWRWYTLSLMLAFFSLHKA